MKTATKSVTELGERARKIGGRTLRSIGDIARHQTLRDNNDVATTSLIEVWIDQTERRTWFLAETGRGM